MLFNVQILIKILTDVSSAIFHRIHINLIDPNQSMSPNLHQSIMRNEREGKQDNVVVDRSTLLLFPRC